MRDEAPIILYGEDGPAFTRLCPKCARFLKFPKIMKWREKLNGLVEFDNLECSKCGPVEPDHIGWAGDFRG